MRMPFFRPPGARSRRALRLPAILPVALLAALAVPGAGASLPAAGAVQEAQESPSPPEPGTELRVWLVTAAPGTAVWERFGHNAIRLLDTRTGRDVSYNWGIFDFDQVDFIPRFLRGEMLYMMAAFPTAPMLDSYLRADRPVALQELALTAAQKDALRSFLEWNALPENREYRYDYFLDNCSTRARDALDQVLAGELGARFRGAPTGTTYRFHTRRLTRMDPLLYTGMDLLLGTPGDQPVSVWEEAFLPMSLREEIRAVEVTGPDGRARPLVLREEVLHPDGSVAESPRTGVSEPTGLEDPGDEESHPWGPPSPPTRFPLYLLLGVALGGLVAWSGGRAATAPPGSRRLARVGSASLAAVWSAGAGFVGTILVLVLFTDHRFMAWNENLFLFSPLSLGLAVLAPMALAGRRGVGAARILGWGVVALALAGLLVQPLPWSRHTNALFFALALPVHLGLAWALERRAAFDRADQAG